MHVDIFYIKSAKKKSTVPVLHIVDEATGFQSGLQLENMRAETLWRALRCCWIDKYLGPPDDLVHDGSSNVLARSFQQNAVMLAIRCQSVPIEAENTMTYVERYHHPVRHTFQIVEAEIHAISFDDCLQTAQGH